MRILLKSRMQRTSNATDPSVAPELPVEATLLTQAGTIPATAVKATTLSELEAQFTSICLRAQTLVAKAGPELCCKRPTAESWSVAECLQHLNVSLDAYFPIWQQMIANAGPRKTEMNAPYRLDFWGRLLGWILEPPPRIRSKTPVHFHPVDCDAIEPVLEGFLDRQQRVIGALRRCRGRAVDQVKMASPADPRIRYSIWSSFVINAAHQRRHLWQAERAVQALQKNA